jgi:hypothetical protein
MDLECDENKKKAIKPLPSFVVHGVSHLSVRFGLLLESKKV